MALPQPSALQMAFTGGVDESTRAELIEPGAAWRVLENVRRESHGAANKRWGFTALTLSRLDATTRSAGRRLFADGDTTCTIDGTHLDAYSPSGTVAKTIGRVPEADIRLHDVPAPGLTNTFDDLAYANGYFCCAWLAQGASLYDPAAAIIDATNFSVVRPPESVTTDVVDVAVAAYSTYFLLFASDAAANTLEAFYLNTASAATITAGWQSIGTIATDCDQGVAVESLTGKVAVVYPSTTANRLIVKTVDSTGVLATNTITTGASPTFVDVAGSSSDTLWVAWNESTDIKVQGLSPTTIGTTVATAATVLSMGTAGPVSIVPTSAAAGRVFANDHTTPLSMRMRSFTTSAGAVSASGSQVVVPNAALCSRGFYANSRTYLHIFSGDYSGSASAAQQQVVLVDATDDVTYVRPVACPTANISVPASYFSRVKTSAGVKPNVPVGATATVRYFPLGIRRGGVANASSVVEYDFASISRWRPVAHGNSTFLSGGILTLFDGSRLTEASFLFRPTKPTGSQTGTGPTTTLGGWRYVATYEDTDSDGNWTLSGVSDPSTITGNFTNKSIAVSTQALSVTSRHSTAAPSSVRVTFYRTTDGGEPPYYRVASVINDTAAASVSYTDNIPDATLATAALLYGTGNLPATNGAAQDRRAPPGTRHAVSYNDMLVVAHGSTLFYSGQQVVGEGAWFSSAFQLPIPGSSEVTALAVQDGSIYAWTRRSIFAIAGDAPNDTGTSGGLGAPRRLAVDVGAAQSPTCTISHGTIFVSDRGIELLSRAQTVDYIGERVKDTFAAYPVVASMTFDPDSSCVLIELAASTSSGAVSGSGRTLVFDTRLGSWTVDRRTNTGGIADSPAQDGAIVRSGSAYRYAWLGTEGRVYVEDHTTHLDPGGTWVTQRAESPKMRPAGIQGNHKLISAVLLAERATNHQTRINVAYDDSSTWTDSETWTAVETAALTREQLEIDCSQEQVMSVQIRVEDLVPSNTTATPLTTGEGAAWVGLALNIGPNNTRQATTLLPAGHRK